MRRDILRSIRSSNRARTSERGFALAIAVALAVLYFGLIQLLMFDASQQLAEARRFRARIVALTLAENGAELAAAGITNPARAMYQGQWNDEFGNASGKMVKGATDPSTGATTFTIMAEGAATGVAKQKATVALTGEVQGNDVRITYTNHSQ